MGILRLPSTDSIRFTSAFGYGSHQTPDTIVEGVVHKYIFV